MLVFHVKRTLSALLNVHKSICLLMNANISKYSSYSACSLPAMAKSSQVQRKSEERKVIISFTIPLLNQLLFLPEFILRLFLSKTTRQRHKIQTRAKYTPEYITTGKGTHRPPNEGQRDAFVFQKV